MVDASAFPDFVWLIGEEGSDPIVMQRGERYRQDQFAASGHDLHMEGNLAAIAELGVRVVRHGGPWRLAEPEPGVYDWDGWDRHELAQFSARHNGEVDLVEVVRAVRPHALVGVSGQGNLFTEELVRTMADGVRHPVVLPPSDPTHRAEARPVDVDRWSGGRALVGSSSPFGPADEGSHAIAEVNNVHVFPGVGLGVVAAGAAAVPDEMMTAAADALGRLSPAARSGPGAPLLPPVAESLTTSGEVAVALAGAAHGVGVAAIDGDSEELVDARRWEPTYRELRP